MSEEGPMQESGKLIISARGDIKEIPRVVPIEQRPFKEIYRQTFATPEEETAAKLRLDELVATGGKIGVFKVIDEYTQKILAEAASYQEAHQKVKEERREILEAVKEKTDYSKHPELEHLAETDIDNFVDGLALSAEHQSLRERKGKGEDVKEEYAEFKKKTESLKERQLRGSYNTEDFLGRHVPEDKRPGATKYHEIKRDILTATDTEAEKLIDERRDLRDLLEKRGVFNINQISTHIDHILENSHQGNVVENLYRYARELEEEARGHPGYTERFYGFARDMVEGVIPVGKASQRVYPDLNSKAVALEGIYKRTMIVTVARKTIENAFSREAPEPGGAMSADMQAALDRVYNELHKQTEMQERSEPEILRISPPVEKDKEHAWVAVVLSKIEGAELATRESQRVSYESEQENTWLAIERFISEQVPSKMGYKHDVLSRYYESEFSEGVYLKERLMLVVRARRRLNDRFIETQKAQGGLTGYGVNISETIQIEKIAPTLNDLEPGDLYMIINYDDIFAPDLHKAGETYTTKLEDGVKLTTEKREVLANVDRGMQIWYEAGMAYDTPIRPGWPSFKQALNNDGLWRELQRRVQEEVGSRTAGTLAYFMLEATATIPFFDRDRVSAQGTGELRDVMHKERQRIEALTKGKLSAKDSVFSIGRYFARKGQGRNTADKIPGGVDTIAEFLRVNAKRAVFSEKRHGLPMEMLGDWWHTITHSEFDLMSVLPEHRDKSIEQLYQEGIFAPGEEPTINRKLISYVLDRNGNITGSFKDIPILKLGKNSYIGYYQYYVNIVDKIQRMLYGKVGVMEGGQPNQNVISNMRDPAFYSDYRRMILNIPNVCPYLNTVEFNARGKLIRDKLKGRFPIEDVEAVDGVVTDRDIDRLPESVREEVRKIVNSQGFVDELRGQKIAAGVWKERRVRGIMLVKALDMLSEGSVWAVKSTVKWWQFNRESAIKMRGGDLNEILFAMQKSCFVEGDWYDALINEIGELKFGPAQQRIRKRK